MKRISKSLRSISPFSRRPNGDSSSESGDPPGSKMNTDELLSPSDEENTSISNGSVDNNKYSLNGVSFKDFLLYFYSNFNPDKISMIDYIAQEYAGDELIMISNLADKYQLSQREMQRLIDVSKRTKRTPNPNPSSNRNPNQVAPSSNKFRAPPSETDSEPESEPNSEPMSELSTSSLRNPSSSPYSQRGGLGRKGVSFSEANSVRTFDRHASPSRSDLASRTSSSPAPSTPASLQDIINRNRQQHDPSVKSNLANKSLLGNSLLSPSQQPGSRKPSPSLRSPSPTIGKGNGPKPQPQPHPAPTRSSSPLQSLVRNQAPEENMDPATQQRMLNQKNLRDKMLQNQQQEAMHQQRQTLLMQQQQEREQQQHQLLEQDEQRQRLARQQQEEEKQLQLQQVVLDDQQYLAQQVRMLSVENNNNQQQQPTEGGSNGNGAAGAGGAAGRTQTVHIEEIQQELARTREALTAADQERDEVLRLLEDMAAAPHSLRMQSVVEEYLAGNRTRSNSLQLDTTEHNEHSQRENAPHQSQYQAQLQRAQAQRNHDNNNNNVSGGDSVISGTSNSNSLRGMRDLKGGQEYRPRTMSPNVRGSGGAGTSKSYMLGTASSSKRETDTAVQGGKSGAFNIHASGNGRHPSPMFERPTSAASSSASSGLRASSTGGQQFGQRFIRPSGSSSPSSRGSRSSRGSSRGRSASPAGSEYSSRRGGGGGGLRSSSPSSSITSADVERQYVNTKQRIDHNTQQAKGNMQMGQRRIEQVSKDAAMERQKALSKKPITDSPSRQRNTNSESVTDWVVCVDPKTQKKYYYSRSLSKSTWTAPPHLAAAAAAATNNTNTNSGPPSRASSVTSKTRGAAPGRGRDRDRDSSSSRGRERERERDSSPAGSITGGSSRHTMRSSSPAGSTASSRGGGGSGGSAIWKSAKDPNSGRTYWFNRKTRESTWKNPFEAA